MKTLLPSLNGIPRIATGVPGLDQILYGGLAPRRFYLIEGYPGTGKTTLSLQFLLEGLAQGEKALYVTLSETKEEVEQVAKSHGWDISDLHLLELEQVKDQLVQEDERNSIFHPSEVELLETTQRIFKLVEQEKPLRVVLDSVSEMRMLAADPLRYRRQILALKQFFSGRNCTVLLLDDNVVSNNDRQLQSICHGVISLEEALTEYSATKRRLRVVKMRGSDFQTGYHNYQIEKGGLTVFPRIIAEDPNIAKNNSQLGSGSGNTHLDALLGGGLEHGTSTLIIGPAGCGKSSLATQFAWNGIQRGERAQAFLFEESIKTFMRRSAGLGMDLRKFVEKGSLKLHQMDPAVLTGGQFACLVKNAVYADQASIILIDSLNGYLNAMPTERHLLLQIHELLTFLGANQVLTVMIMAQHGMVASGMTPPIDVSYLADTVLVTRFFEAHGRVMKALSVLKKRSGEHESTIREMHFSGKGVVISDPLEEFQGVLTGVPRFVGKEERLIHKNG